MNVADKASCLVGEIDNRGWRRSRTDVQGDA